MHVTACLAGEKEDVEVGEECRSLQALKEAIVEALPKLCVDGFDVSVGGRALDDDEGVVSLQEGVSLDVSANARALSVRTLREDNREVSEDGLLHAAFKGDVPLVTLFLDAGVPIDCANSHRETPLHLSCYHGHKEITALLLDRGAAIDEKDGRNQTPLHFACMGKHPEIARLLLDRGTAAIDQRDSDGETPLFISCSIGRVDLVQLLLDRGGSTAIDMKSKRFGDSPFIVSCRRGCLSLIALLLDHECYVEVDKTLCPYPQEILDLLSERGYDAFAYELP